VEGRWRVLGLTLAEVEVEVDVEEVEVEVGIDAITAGMASATSSSRPRSAAVRMCRCWPRMKRRVPARVFGMALEEAEGAGAEDVYGVASIPNDSRIGSI
jgi:hypothetical protein